MTVNDLVTTGTTRLLGFYPVLEHYAIFGIYKLFGGIVSSVTISQYFNPFFGALTIVPVFLLTKKLSNTKIALLAGFFWTFSEASFYRTSTFTTTETLAFFIAIFALYFYVDKKYVPTAILLGLTFYSHLLPGFFAVLVIFIHQFITRSLKIKIASLASLVAIVAFLLSPLNPQQRLVSVLNPVSLLNHFNLENIFLYSVNDLILGLTLFLGLVLLGVLALISLATYRVQNKFMFSMLLTAIGLFVFGWVVYSPQLFAPPRLTLYFVVPLSFYVAFLMSKMHMPKIFKFMVIALIAMFMVSSTFASLDSVLWVQNSVTNNEYRSLDDLQKLGVFNVEPDRWWSDYPIRVAITARTINLNLTVSLNETEVKILSTEMSDQYTVLEPQSLFKYVFFSERMKNESLFLIYTNNRTQQIRKPISDIWSNSTMWKLIYSNYGVKVYGRT